MIERKGGGSGITKCSEAKFPDKKWIERKWGAYGGIIPVKN
jgi:hypothetical protein